MERGPAAAVAEVGVGAGFHEALHSIASALSAGHMQRRLQAVRQLVVH